MRSPREETQEVILRALVCAVNPRHLLDVTIGVHSAVQTVQSRQEALEHKDPSWRETRMCMRDIRCSVFYAKRDRSNPFAEVELDLVPPLTWCNTSSCHRSFG